MNRNIIFLLICISFAGLFCGCRKDSAGQGSQAGDAAGETVPAPDHDMRADMVFIQGPVFRGGIELPPIAEGGALPLSIGDHIVTGENASVEISFGAFGTVRLLPSSVLFVRDFAGGNGPARVELRLEQGAVLAKVKRSSGGDEFLISTPNAAGLVRGTHFLMAYDEGSGTPGSGITTVAVQEGYVAALPKGEIFEQYLGNRGSDAVSAAVVRTAFSLAGGAGDGEEISIGNRDGERASREMAEAEAAYGTLSSAAEERAVQEAESLSGDEIAETLAPAGSDIRKILEASLKKYGPVSFGAGSGALLEFLDHVREPGSLYSAVPAALPEGFFSLYRERRDSSSGGTGPSMPEPQPDPYPALLWNTELAGDAPVRAVDRAGTVLLALDGSGGMYGLDERGRVLWNLSGGLALAALDRDAALTESGRLVLLDGNSGREKGEWAFDGWAALPRTKAVPVSGGVALATPRGVAILRQENAQLLREIPVAGGVVSPLVSTGNELIGISGSGSLVIMDVSGGRVRVEVIAGLGGDILAPKYQDGRVYAANRSGRVLAVELESGNILWERNLNTSIGAEPEIDASLLYLWTGNRLLRLSLRDGGDAGEAIEGVESPPLLSNGRIYWGTGASLVTADASTGRVLRTEAIPGSVSVRPLLVGGNLYIGTNNGRMIKMSAD